jgi:hypothetical protein
MDSKKRKASFQLSPYTNDEDFMVSAGRENEASQNRRIARAQAKPDFVTYGGKYTNLFAGAKLFPDLPKEQACEKMASLNASFQESLKRVLERDSAKDLRFLFTQYTTHLESILKETPINGKD